MLIEKISKHLGVKYIYLPEKKLFLCENGAPFTLEEYRQGIDLPSEYKRRKYEGKFFDYAYAKSTGLLRKKRGYSKMLVGSSPAENEPWEKQNNEGVYKESFEKIATENLSITEQKKNGETVPKVSEDDTNG